MSQAEPTRAYLTVAHADGSTTRIEADVRHVAIVSENEYESSLNPYLGLDPTVEPHLSGVTLTVTLTCRKDPDTGDFYSVWVEQGALGVIDQPTTQASTGTPQGERSP